MSASDRVTGQRPLVSCHHDSTPSLFTSHHHTIRILCLIFSLGWFTPSQAVALPGQCLKPLVAATDQATAPAFNLSHQNNHPIQVSADAAIVDAQQQQIQASGTVVWQQPDLHLNADQLTYQLAEQTGQASQVSYYLPAIPARGSATQAKFQDSSRSHYQDISYTTCPPEQTDWQLQAEQLMLDQNAGWGTLHHATLRFMDVPIGYTPWLRFPLDDRRQSGFLPPSLGYSDTHGIQLKTPYYFNLAPNYDITLKPVTMSRRGLLLGSESRFLTHTTQGEIQADYLPHDRQYTGKTQQRGHFAWRSRSQHNPNLYSSIDLNYVSDPDYLTDFADTLSTASTTLLPRSVELGYLTDNWTLQARIKDYQRLNTGAQPYRLFPQITLHKRHTGQLNQPQYHLDAELVRFDQPDNTVVAGTRLDIAPSISWPQQGNYYHFTPKLGVRYTRYQLNQTPHNPDRFSQHLSLDGGLSFERPFTYRNKPSLQTLEPRLQYQYIHAEQQDNLPVFDTADRTVSLHHLFREDRFTGADRVGDTNQLAVGLTSRILDPQTQHNYLTASIGQIFYFQDRQVTLPEQTPATDTRSAVVGSVQAEPTPHWQINSTFAWRADTPDQLTLQAVHRPNQTQSVSMTYRRHTNVTEHTDLSVNWPLTEKVQLLGRWQYDLHKQRTHDAVLGVEYRTCCWRLQAVAHNALDKQEQNNLSFLLQLELNGLGKLGQSMDHLLR
jgi:LPS-assembly protein